MILWTENTDLGVTTWCEMTREEASVDAARKGAEDGYPECCVSEYAEDLLRGRHPFLRRGIVPDGDEGVYVPCSRCCVEMGREIIP